jgi:hypothetical protein
MMACAELVPHSVALQRSIFNVVAEQRGNPFLPGISQKSLILCDWYKYARRRGAE